MMMRYSRQMLLPEIGRPGQEQLQSSKVLIIGAGGLGSTCAMYLAASGVNTDVLDFDTVELSNLHRQIIHSESSTGSLKALSAVARMKSINSTVACRALTCKLTADNAESIIAQYDLVVDATDNIESRYLINDCCVLLNKPLISGSAVSMDGQITVIVPYLSPCYRCIYPDVPSAQASGCRSCADVGVLGPVPGLIGCLQAIEAMKLLLTTNTSRSSKNHSKLSDDDHDGPEHTFMSSSSSSSSRNRGDDPHCVTITSSDTCMLPLLGRQVMYDGLSGEFHCFQLPSRDLSCKVCGDSPSILSMVDSKESLSSCGPDQSLIEEEDHRLKQHTISAIDYHRIISTTNTDNTDDDSPSIAITPHVLIDVRSTEQFSITSLSIKDMVVYSDLNACIRDLSAILERKRTAHPSSTDDGDGDDDQPMTMYRLQVNVPLSVLQGGQQAATRWRLRDEVFRSIRQVCELLRAINTNTSTSSLSDSDSDSDGFSGSSIYLVCRRGIASLAALKLFLSAEVSITASSSSSSSSSSQQLQQQVFHIEGGLTAWSTDVDKSFEMY